MELSYGLSYVGFQNYILLHPQAAPKNCVNQMAIFYEKIF